MTILKKTVTTAIFLLLIAPAQAANEAEIGALIEEAETLRQQAASVDFEWRYTAKRIKGATEALAAGKLEEAQKLAARAKREAELAIEQAEKAKIVWKLAVPQ